MLAAVECEKKAGSLYHEQQHLGHCAVHALNNLFQEQWTSYTELNQIATELQAVNNGVSDSIFGLNPFKSAIPFMGYFDIACIIKALEKKNCRVSEHIVKLDHLVDFDFFPKMNKNNVSPAHDATGSSSSSSLKEDVETATSTSLSSEEGEKGDNQKDIIGLIVNTEDFAWGFGSSNHWICLLKVDTDPSANVINSCNSNSGSDKSTHNTNSSPHITRNNPNGGGGYVNLDSKLHSPVFYPEVTLGRSSALGDYLREVMTPNKAKGHLGGQIFVISKN